MKLRDYLLLLAAGIAMHQTARLTKRLPSVWERLTNYVVGVEGVFPFYVMMLKRQQVDDESIARASAAYQLAFLGGGLGVALGWLLDMLIGARE